MPRRTIGDLFLELAKPDADGFSRPVRVSEFTDRYARLQMGNGGGWCRDDGPLARRFNIRRHKSGGRIVAVELQGWKKQPIEKPIPAHVKQQVISDPCVVLAVSNVECDHKDGRRDDPRLSDGSRVTIDDFQPLSKAANNAKRQHCKRCRETGGASTPGGSDTASASSRATASTTARASAATGTTPSGSTTRCRVREGGTKG